MKLILLQRPDLILRLEVVGGAELDRRHVQAAINYLLEVQKDIAAPPDKRPRRRRSPRDAQ